MVWLVPLVCFATGLGIGHWLRARGEVATLLCLVTLCAIGIGYLYWQALRHTGYDALGYGIGAILFIMPGSLGLLAGAALAWWRARRKAPPRD